MRCKLACVSISFMEGLSCASMHRTNFVWLMALLFGAFATKRRRRDLNPRAAINDLHPFQGCPFDLLGTSPSK